ncbi:MAG: TIGR04076 family protein [Ruminococcaceae bacterium]|nr:TIGR04076 family protein [Oscillospiraceae bacterium]
MPKVKLTVIESRCRCGYLKKGETFIVDDLCPPVCHELWHSMYPFIYVLKNGGDLDHGESRAKVFDIRCPDESRVWIHGEVTEE